jgi:hypothetical protein
MTRGAFRIYFHIPFTKLGIKIASFGDSDDANRVCIFLTAMVMNILERKRYKYYVLRKPMKQWGRIWKTREEEPLWFNPTYFTCGLFNIVHHCDRIYSEDNVIDTEEDLDDKTGYLVDDTHPQNFAKTDDHPLCIDYGDFNISRFNCMNVRLIDYQ